MVGGIFAHEANDVVTLQYVTPASVSNQPWYFMFQYLVRPA
jgi:hypothetical protein